jgi:hypothetical protein
MNKSNYETLSEAVKASSTLASQDFSPCQSKKYDEQFLLRSKVDGRVLPDIRYSIETSTGIVEGVTDSQGRTGRISSGGKPSKLILEIEHEPMSIENEETQAQNC